MFLRFINPAIVSPYEAGILDKKPLARIERGLKLMSKVKNHFDGYNYLKFLFHKFLVFLFTELCLNFWNALVFPYVYRFCFIFISLYDKKIHETDTDGTSIIWEYFSKCLLKMVFCVIILEIPKWETKYNYNIFQNALNFSCLFLYV